MLLNKVGEFGLIERFKKHIKTDSSVVVGSGDDCAVLKFNKDKYQLLTCDMIVEGVDFTLKDRLDLIGRKALAISISDIASCAGIPRHAVVSMGIPKRLKVESVEKIAKGLFALADKFKVNIVGGDLSASNRLTIDVSLLGEVEKNRLLLRKGAKIGDIIFVTGSLGGSISGKHLKFTPRLKEARFLAGNFKVNAMIDVSDSLTQDLGHILKASNAGAVIYEALIPLSKEAVRIEDALYGGEEFELLFTMPLKDARKLMKKGLGTFNPIGRVTGKRPGLILVDKFNKEKHISPKGYRHF
jgi:thiamine-monophosphate kinase